eukprot:CAMPEP_0117658708 /NCGR_PEP_ID=MMETSP0804-20121206/6007_1 /TAXON_ID=1074897 /ORGANISM="Tetraselmis astigmatica, Strain CCMP880" /LENGTH=46 /DNA_ID= /DNA_START= /DNA_END= /DNA_ORIENTATION=
MTPCRYPEVCSWLGPASGGNSTIVLCHQPAQSVASPKATHTVFACG